MNPTISTIPIQQLTSGDRISLQVYKFVGSQPGKKAYLQGNLHGCEIVGNAVIHQFIDFLSTLDDTQLTGEIWLVPVCNPASTNQRSHFFATGGFNPYDGQDWNRIFWDYEKECDDLEDFAQSQLNFDTDEIRNNYLARIQSTLKQHLQDCYSQRGLPFRHIYRYQLQSLCIDANYVIDIHSSTNQGLDFLYGFYSREESAKDFLFDYGIVMHEDEYDGDAFDEAFIKPWQGLEKALAKLGRTLQFDIESWTLELGSGMQMNPESVKKGVYGIKNYLSKKGMLKLPDLPITDPNSYHMKLASKDNIERYYAPAGGMIQSRVELGSVVNVGDRLYQLLSFNKEGNLPNVIDIKAETDGLIFDISTNYSANQGEYVLSIRQFDN